MEFALVTAIALPLVLLALQVAMLVTFRLSQVNANATLAAVASQDGPGAAFDAAIASEAARIGCEAPRATVESQDGIVVVELDCTWHAPSFPDASWPVSTSASAVAQPEPSPTPEPSIIEESA